MEYGEEVTILLQLRKTKGITGEPHSVIPCVYDSVSYLLSDPQDRKKIGFFRI